MNRFLRTIKTFWILSMLLVGLAGTACYVMAAELLPYQDPSQPEGRRVADLLGRMTLEEKFSQMGHSAPAIDRLGIAAHNWWNEGLHGVLTGGITVFPQAIGMASTWNPELIHEVATAISDEARVKHMQGAVGLTFWSPVINIGRDPRWGRTEEAYGEDVYLTSRIAVAFVKGFQGDDPRYLKLVSTPKHFAANNEEYRRTFGSSTVEERSLREYYFPAFKTCITEAGAQSVMSAYNGLNGVPCTGNEWLLTEVLRKEWGFDGYVVSDCDAVGLIRDGHHYVATHAEAAAMALKAGCDLNCGATYQTSLHEALAQGLITEADLDRALGRLMAARFRLGMFDPPELVPYTRISPDVVGSKEHVELARETARQSIVLLKNDSLPATGKPLLPLDPKKLKSVAVLGPNAAVCRFGGYTGSPLNPPVSPLEGIKAAAEGKFAVNYVSYSLEEVIPTDCLRPAEGTGEGLTGHYFDNRDLAGQPVFTRLDAKVDFMWGDGSPDAKLKNDNYSVRGTGKLVAPRSGVYRLGATTDDGVRLWLDGKQLLDNWHERAATTNLATVTLEAGQSYDLQMDYYEAGGTTAARLVWVMPNQAQPDVSSDDVAIVVLGLDGSIEAEGNDRETLGLPDDQEAYIKTVVASNPRTVVVLVAGSPVAINWIKTYVPAVIQAWYPGEQGGNAIADVLFGKYNPAGRLPMTCYRSLSQLPPFDDYDVTKGRTYMYLEKTPLFPFGHGLSYTSFAYSNLKISSKTTSATSTVKVSLDVTNVGDLDGDEVVQLYTHDVESSVKQPLKQLRGFQRVHLRKGETRRVTFNLAAVDLTYWDVDKDAFVVEPGDFDILIGASSSGIRLRDKITVK